MRIAPVSTLLVSFVGSALLVQAAAPVPRPAKDFTITLPSGKQAQISAYRGKVVLAAFMFTTCPHCQALSKVITKLQNELGSRGFQAVGAAFNDEVNTPDAAANEQVTAKFISDNGVGFPVGYASRTAVMNYLSLSDVERWVVPQVVIIDRKGVIRAQSAASGTADLQTESYLRKYLGDLLNEGAAPAKAGTPSKAPAKKADKKTS